MLNDKIIIVTHDGKFHADEMVAIGLILSHTPLGNKPRQEFSIYRIPKSNNLNEVNLHLAELGLVLTDVDYLLDTGRELNPKLGYFNHHQYLGGLSTAGLIWEYIVDKYSLNLEHNKKTCEFIKMIDDNDTGVKICEVGQLPDIVNAFDDFIKCKHPLTVSKYINDIGTGLDMNIRIPADAPSSMVVLVSVINMITTYVLELKKQADLTKTNLEYLKTCKTLLGVPAVLILHARPKGISALLTTEHLPGIEAVTWKNYEDDTWSIKTVTLTSTTYDKVGRSLPEDKNMHFVHKAGFYAVAKDMKTMITYCNTHLKDTI